MRRRRSSERAARAAAPWYRARFWSGSFIGDLVGQRAELGRRLTAVELQVYALDRQAVAMGFSGLQVSVAELAAKLDKSERTIQRALDGLGDHHHACVDNRCKRPGVDKRGRLLCRGCARPCPTDCVEHVRLVRRVPMFVPVAWKCSANVARRSRQGRSTLVLGTAAREPGERMRWSAPPGVKSVTPEHPVSAAPKGLAADARGAKKKEKREGADSVGKSTRARTHGQVGAGAAFEAALQSAQPAPEAKKGREGGAAPTTRAERLRTAQDDPSDEPSLLAWCPELASVFGLEPPPLPLEVARRHRATVASLEEARRRRAKELA